MFLFFFIILLEYGQNSINPHRDANDLFGNNNKKMLMTRSLISRGEGQAVHRARLHVLSGVMLSRCQGVDCLPSELAQSTLGVLPRRQEDRIA